MISYRCSKCGAELESPSSLAGQEDKCPACGHVCAVPKIKGRMPLIMGICGGGAAVVLLVVGIFWLWPRGNESAGPPGEQLSRVPLAADPKPRVEPKPKPRTPKVREPAKYLTLDLGKGVTMKLVLIPAGSFLMGSPRSDLDREEDRREEPQHKVTISKPFYMGLTEVTQEQYEAVIGKNPAEFRGAKNPVEQVSWDDGVAFCKALSKKGGKTVRLPTEAEWEYACRAGTKTRFYFGDDDKQLGDYAWYFGNSGEKPHPVGQKKPNPWGLHDMHGNVWEWCADWEAAYSAEEQVDPQAPALGGPRVLRGGSWYSDPDECFAADRVRFNPIMRWNYIGFRVVVEAG